MQSSKFKVQSLKHTIISFGEILWDILPTETKLGGAPFNFTYRVSSLGNRGLMVSRLGKDELGEKAIESVKSLGMETAFLQWDEKLPTGTVKVSFDELNNPDYVIIPDVAYDNIEIEDSLENVASDADCFCFGTLAQRSNRSRQSLERLIEAAAQAVKLLDINLRKKCYSPETVKSSLEKADILKCNGDEIREIARMLDIQHKFILEMCQALMEKYKLGYCLVTLDNRGAFVLSREGEKIYVQGHKVKLVDSLGAGDAFTAGFIHSILNKKTLRESGEFGNVLGAIVCTQEGATMPILQNDIDEFMKAGHEREHDFYFDQFLG
jgi:fructokinase